MTVTLQPMSEERYAAWSERLVAMFAQEKVNSGNWLAEGALERSAKENANDLPQGLDTPGHDIFSGMVDGEEVGVLWLFTDPALTVPEAMIYDIEIAEQHRGRGLGRELLTAARDAAPITSLVCSSSMCSARTLPRSACMSRPASRPPT